MKCQYGSAKSALADPEENINITGTNGRESKTISSKQLADIIGFSSARTLNPYKGKRKQICTN